MTPTTKILSGQTLLLLVNSRHLSESDARAIAGLKHDALPGLTIRCSSERIVIRIIKMGIHRDRVFGLILTQQGLSADLIGMLVHAYKNKSPGILIAADQPISRSLPLRRFVHTTPKHL